MEQKITQVHHTSKDELLQSIINGVDKKLNEFKTSFLPKEPTRLLNRKQAAMFFGVTTVTIDSWSEKGILIAYRTGNRKFFKRKELENALTKIGK